MNQVTDAGEETGRAYADGFWQSEDGLKLHYRDYRGPEGGHSTPVLCIPGLTRNARDFEDLAKDLCRKRRVVCAELRGRGDSEYATDPATYNPVQYVRDIAILLEEAKIERAVFVGTSLGGIVTMLLAATHGDRIAGAVLNDVGPVIEPDGMARIAGYVGQGRNFPTWMHAARAQQEIWHDAFPDFQVPDWLAFAKRVMVLGSNGRIASDYDLKIAEAFNAPPSGNGEPDPAPAPDLWPAFAMLEGRPVLVLRGALSDILSGHTAREMVGRMPGVELVTLANRGHAPTLDEPESREGIARLLERVG